MRRVVVTGLGITSCIGNNLTAVSHALKESVSGIRYNGEYAALGLRSQVSGIPDVSQEAPIDRKIRRFMGDASIYAYYAMQKAIADSQLEQSLVSDIRTGLIVGSGVGSPYEHIASVDHFRKNGLNKVLPYAVPRVMGSTTSACLSTAFKMQGISTSMTSACATSAHCIGYGAELIQLGKQDIVFAGGAEEVKWTSTMLFDAMGALSTASNDVGASKPFDVSRDGFVIAGGAGLLVLEEYEHAVARDAHIYGELLAYSTCSDGVDMVTPDKSGSERVMRLALEEAKCEINYINAHATSTPLGDLAELEAIKSVFGDNYQGPIVASTKGLTGHPIAASAAHEAIYSLLMLDQGFVAGCANITLLDSAASGLNIQMRSEMSSVKTIMSNSFGFGGNNACLVFGKL